MYNQYYDTLDTVKFRYEYANIINPILERDFKDCRYYMDPEKLNDELNVLQILLENDLITNQEYFSFLNKLESGNFKYVYENNQWSFLNKLNTNSKAAPYVLINYLSDHYPNNDQIIESLESLKKNNECRKFFNLVNEIMEDKNNQNIVYYDYIMEPIHYNNIVNKIQTTSMSGDNNENNVMNTMREHGWEILYSGGNGRLIDQFFKIDIVGKLDNTILTVQVKPAARINPVKIQHLSDDNFYLIELNDDFDVRGSYFNSLAFITQRCDVIGFGKQQKYFKDSTEKWRISTINNVFPEGNELLIEENNIKFITTGLSLIYPAIY